MFWKGQYDAIMGLGLVSSWFIAFIIKDFDTFIAATMIYFMVRMGVWFINLFMTAFGVPLFYYNKVLFDDE